MKVLLIIIIAVLVIGALFIFLLVKSLSAATQGPSEAEIIGTINSALGHSIGPEFEVLSSDYNWMPDAVTKVVVKIPKSRFEELLELCKDSAEYDTDTEMLIQHEYYNSGVPVHVESVRLDKLGKTIHFHSYNS